MSQERCEDLPLHLHSLSFLPATYLPQLPHHLPPQSQGVFSFFSLSPSVHQLVSQSVSQSVKFYYSTISNVTKSYLPHLHTPLLPS